MVDVHGERDPGPVGGQDGGAVSQEVPTGDPGCGGSRAGGRSTGRIRAPSHRKHEVESRSFLAGFLAIMQVSSPPQKESVT